MISDSGLLFWATLYRPTARVVDGDVHPLRTSL